MVGERRGRKSGRLGAAMDLSFCLVVTACLCLVACAETPTPFDASSDPAPLPGVPGWVPIDCSDRPTELRHLWARAGAPDDAWEQRERQSRTAEPGEARYVPHPYPLTRGELLANFEYWYFLRHPKRPRNRDGKYGWEVYDAIRDGRMVYEIMTVVNWGPGRCAPLGYRPHHYLVRLLDDAGTEVARASLDASGELVASGGGGWGHRLEDLSSSELEAVMRRHGIGAPIQAVQRVSLAGIPGGCSIVLPCVAVRAGGSIYVLYQGREAGIFEIPPDSRRYSVAAYNLHLRQIHEDTTFVDLCGYWDPEDPVLSLGYEWAQAHRVADLGDLTAISSEG